MHVHFVLAHPEPNSFNAQLVREGVACLESQGWSTSVSDLYTMGFDPCERPSHFQNRINPDRFDAQAEQRQAADNSTLPTDVKGELDNLDRADLVILQYPMWWHMPPAILKGWFDRVWAYGAAYTSQRRFEEGRFAGKRAMLSITVGTSRETYAHDGRSGDIDLMVWPVNFNLAYTGFTVLEHYISYGVEAGLRYSDPQIIEARLAAIIDDFSSSLLSIEQRPKILFNRKSEWGDDGKIRADAPVFSPFVRRKQHLEIE